MDVFIVFSFCEYPIVQRLLMMLHLRNKDCYLYDDGPDGMDLTST